MSDDHHCGFVNGPCPNPKKCVFPRCDIEFSGSPVWAVLRRVVTFNDATAAKPPPPPDPSTTVDDNFD